MQSLTNNENNLKNEMEITYAGFLPRFIAFVIDIIIASIASFFIKNIMLAGFSSIEIFTKQLLFTYSVVDIFSYIIKVSYFIICVYCTQTTVGKYVMKLKVVDKNFGKLSLLSVIYRETIGRFLSSFLFVGYLLIFIQKDKAALHDILADSRVIYACTVKKTVLVNRQMAAPLANPSMTNPSMTNPSMVNPSMVNPGANPSMANPGMANPNMANPSANPGMANPSVANPGMANPNIANSNSANPNTENMEKLNTVNSNMPEFKGDDEHKSEENIGNEENDVTYGGQ